MTNHRTAARPDRSRVWRLLDLGRCDPLRAVAFSEAIAPFVARGSSPDTLLFSRTDSPCISVGYHQSPDTELDPGFVRRHRLPVVRRVEGGGAVYLDPDQLYYQFVYAGSEWSPGGPNDLVRYLGAVREAVRSLGLPAELRPPSDIVVRGRKLSGNAGGEWQGAQIITGDILGRSDVAAMSSILWLPHPALRPLLRREMSRWVTSWQQETGEFPDWDHITRAIARSFEARGLGRLEPETTTAEEENQFRSETVPRHRDLAWRTLPPLPRRSDQPSRRVVVAGPHGFAVYEDPSDPDYLVAMAEGSELVEGYRLGRDPNARLRRLPSPRRGLPVPSAGSSEPAEA